MPHVNCFFKLFQNGPNRDAFGENWAGTIFDGGGGDSPISMISQMGNPPLTFLNLNAIRHNKCLIYLHK